MDSESQNEGHVLLIVIAILRRMALVVSLGYRTCTHRRLYVTITAQQVHEQWICVDATRF